MGMEGIGVYIRKLLQRRHGTPKQAAKRASDHKISFLPFLGAWQQPNKQGKVVTRVLNKRDVLARYVDACHSKNIVCGLWYYPWAGHEEELVDRLVELSDGLPIQFWLNDAELGFKWKKKLSDKQLAKQFGTNMRAIQPEAIRGTAAEGSKTWVQACARRLMDLVAEARDDGHFGIHGFTSYGIAQFHPNFPWEIFIEAADFVSPQLYKAEAKHVDFGIDNWYERAADPTGVVRERAGYMVPSIGTYGPKSGANMHDHLSAFVDSNEGVDGFIAWSWMQTNSQEWDVLARWADWIDRGACMLPPKD